MFCKNCGKEINDDSIFCTYCGYQANVNFTSSQEEITKENTNSISNKFNLSIPFSKNFLLCICILIIDILLILITPNNSIIGSWILNNDDTIILTFTSNGEVTNNFGYYGTYEIKGNTLIMYEDGYKTEEYTYKKSGKNLNLYYLDYDSNERITLTKQGIDISFTDIMIVLISLLFLTLIFFSSKGKNIKNKIINNKYFDKFYNKL